MSKQLLTFLFLFGLIICQAPIGTQDTTGRQTGQSSLQNKANVKFANQQNFFKQIAEAKKSLKHSFIKNKRGELNGNAQEGYQGIEIIIAMIKDLENRSALLRQYASGNYSACIATQDALQCNQEQQWKDKIAQNQQGQSDITSQNAVLRGQITALQQVKDDLNKNWLAAKEAAKQKAISNVNDIIVMIQKIIKVMVGRYNITTNEDLSQLPSLVQIAQDIEEFKSREINQDDTFQSQIMILLQQNITSYDNQQAQKFVQLLEVLINKLRAKLSDLQNNFQYDDSQLKSDLSAQDAKIAALQKQIDDNNVSYTGFQQSTDSNNDKISKCSDDTLKRAKCNSTLQDQTKLVNDNDDLLAVLRQVLIDTKAVLGIVDESANTFSESTLLTSDEQLWLSQQIQSATGLKTVKLNKIKTNYYGPNADSQTFLSLFQGNRRLLWIIQQDGLRTSTYSPNENNIQRPNCNYYFDPNSLYFSLNYKQVYKTSQLSTQNGAEGYAGQQYFCAQSAYHQIFTPWIDNILVKGLGYCSSQTNCVYNCYNGLTYQNQCLQRLNCAQQDCTWKDSANGLALEIYSVDY